MESTMIKLKDGRYQQQKAWTPCANCNIAPFRDTQADRNVMIKEFTRLRYPASTCDAEGNEYPSLVEAAKRCDQYIEKSQRINETIKSVARDGGDVVVTLDFFRDGNKIYKVMERVDMVDWVKNPNEIHRHLTLNQIDTLFSRACRAVDALHQAGIYHGDLKTDNLFIVERDGQMVAMVSDFDDSSFMREEIDLTDTACTPEYCPPEVFLNNPKLFDLEDIEVPEPLSVKHIGTASDVFALGIIYHEYLSGHRPEMTGDDDQLGFALLNGQEAIIDPAISPARRLLIGRMLALLPEQRVQTCADVAREIKEIHRREEEPFVLEISDMGKPFAQKRIRLFARYGSGEDAFDVEAAVLTTDKNGHAGGKGLTAAHYYVACGGKEIPVVWQETGKGKKAVISIRAPKARFTLTVLFNDAPVKNRRVRLFPLDGGEPLEAATDGEGRAVFEGLQGECSYRSECAGLQEVFTWGAEKKHTARHYTYHISALVDDNPLKSTTVTLMYRDAEGCHTIEKTTDDAGLLTVFDAGCWSEMRVKAAGIDCPIQWDSRRSAVVRVQTKTRLTIHVRTADRKDMEGARLTLGKSVDRHFARLFTIRTNDKGLADFGVLEEGRYYIQAELPSGFKPKNPGTLPLNLKDGRGAFVLEAVEDDEDPVVLDEAIPERISSLYSWIKKRKSGTVQLTFRKDGRIKNTRTSQLVLMGLEAYM